MSSNTLNIMPHSPAISIMNLHILIPFPLILKRPQLEVSSQPAPLPVPFHCELDPDECADSVLSQTVFLAPPKALAEEGGVFVLFFWGSVSPQWMETDTQQFFTQQQAM